MVIVLGIESTAHTFGIGIVKNGKILANVKDAYTTESGGIIPIDSAKHHSLVADELVKKALNEAKVSWKEIKGIAFSQGPGLSPCLLVGLRKAKELSKKHKLPLIPVNHCVAHLEIGRITGAKDPVLLYASGANTQIIAYSSGKYRIFGETLDLGIGNFIDTFARYLGLGFPGGPKVEQLAKNSKNYIELPYTVKGMDITLSGILTNLRQKIEKINLDNKPLYHLPDHPPLLDNVNNKSYDNINFKNDVTLNNLENKNKINYTKEDLAFSMQETVFAMLVEVSERALAHVGKKELVLGGGVACNSRFQEMCRVMCEERGCKFYVPEKNLLVDNAGMIAYLGEIMFKAGIKFEGMKAEDLDIKPRERTDEINVTWR
ncbi:MAG: tRNA (adenosine(37)-N6)-threonylcarbamoyltransferase complex transferase subunit TsaD [Nanoarchaeota archaeon]